MSFWQLAALLRMPGSLAKSRAARSVERPRTAVAKLDFGPLAERAPTPVVPIRKIETFATNLLPPASSPKDEAPDLLAKAKKIRGLQWSGRLDLNQRPLAPQACPEAAQASSTLPNAAEPFRSAPLPAVQGSQRFVTIHRDFATNLLPAIEQLLTVRQVARFLGVCTATVYKWAAEGCSRTSAS